MQSIRIQIQKPHSMYIPDLCWNATSKLIIIQIQIQHMSKIPKIFRDCSGYYIMIDAEED